MGKVSKTLLAAWAAIVILSFLFGYFTTQLVFWIVNGR
jgi:hypothetical protein